MRGRSSRSVEMASSVMLAPPPLPALPQRLRRAWFADPVSAVISSLLLVALTYCLWQALRWAVWGAVADVNTCPSAPGACWAVVIDKHRLVLLGRYPQGEQWRPVLASVLLLGGVGIAALPRCFGRVGLAILVASL